MVFDEQVRVAFQNDHAAMPQQFLIPWSFPDVRVANWSLIKFTSLFRDVLFIVILKGGNISLITGTSITKSLKRSFSSKFVSSYAIQLGAYEYELLATWKFCQSLCWKDMS